MNGFSRLSRQWEAYDVEAILIKVQSARPKRKKRSCTLPGKRGLHGYFVTRRIRLRFTRKSSAVSSPLRPLIWRIRGREVFCTWLEFRVTRPIRGSGWVDRSDSHLSFCSWCSGVLISKDEPRLNYREAELAENLHATDRGFPQDRADF